MQTNNTETLKCCHKAHNRKGGSIYPNDSVPIALFRKDISDPNSVMTKSCIDCRKYAAKLKAKSSKYQREQILNQINRQTSSHTRCCSYSSHNSLSDYERDKVPFELFLSNPEDVESVCFKMCLDCRKYSQKHDQIKAEKLKQKNEQVTDTEFRFCGGKHHHTKSGSVYERNKVPIIFFRKIPNNPNSDLFKICVDCRNYKKIVTTPSRKKLIETKIETSKNEGNIVCRNCKQPKSKDQMHVKKDGTIGLSCILCNNKGRKRKDNLKKCYENIQNEFINLHECSCQRCKCIIIKHKDKNFTCIKLKTYNINDVNYVDYENQTYNVKDFLLNHDDLLELRVLEFDHLPENEQRSKGLLSDNDIYVPKRQQVNNRSSEHLMRLEARKCQILCIECHVITTMSREKGGRIINTREQQKLDYVYKQKSKGCTICGYVNLKLPRYFDMDHLDPKTKTEGIANMIIRNKYSLEHVIKECELCRVLCKQCHKLHTHEQIQNGIIEKKDK